MEDHEQNINSFKNIYKVNSDGILESTSIESLLDASYYDGDITEELVGTLSEMSEEDHQSVIYFSEEDIFDELYKQKPEWYQNIFFFP